MGELSQTMGYQRYLMRNCQYSLMLEVLSPMQYTILLVGLAYSLRSLILAQWILLFNQPLEYPYQW